MRRLIINADDFGFTPAVTSGILEAHEAGAVTSTSMMVHCAGWDDAVRRARDTPTLGVGLHLNLLVGAPMSRVPSLTDRRTGRFLPLAALTARALTGRIEPGEVIAECEMQLRAIGESGIVCTHVDSHRHTHALPVIHRAVSLVAARRALPLRHPVESQFRGGGALSHVHRGAVAAAWHVTGAFAPRTRAPDHFIGISMQGASGFAGLLASAIGHLWRGTTELMVHPGRVDAALEAADGYTWQRERELAALVSPALRERLGRPGVKLISFAQL